MVVGQQDQARRPANARSRLSAAPPGDHAIIDWLLDADPAIRWQVQRDLLDASPDIWSRERARIAAEGWGARLLDMQDADGQWAGGAFVPRGFTRELWEQEGQPWTATTFALSQLREFGLDPASPAARRTVESIGRHARWDEGDQLYWQGEVEECINGRTVADGAYFGVDVSALVERLVGERQPDGGWNCERANGSLRSSFHSTVNVLEGLLEFEKSTTGETPTARAARSARRGGEGYLLERGLYRRLSTGAPASERFLSLHHPNRWQYDILRALDYFRSASMFDGSRPDPRLGPAIDRLRERRTADGRWNLDWTPAGRVWFAVDPGPGAPSRWLTLRALRVLRWWDRLSS